MSAEEWCWGGTGSGVDAFCEGESAGVGTRRASLLGINSGDWVGARE